jgi:hypothetical protein
VRAKQKLDQALNVKEFAVLAGISYSVAREWFQSPGFPAVFGKIFWQDFLLWRRARSSPKTPENHVHVNSACPTAKEPQSWPPRAATILSQANGG